MPNEKICTKIKAILAKNHSCRDNMMLTVSMIHSKELKEFGKSKNDYFDLLFSGKLSSIKTIDRMWRYVQEKNPHLRGKKWKQRQVSASEVKKEFYTQKKLFNE
jgi:hypothetical protein